jgi:hypothetical protein
MLQNASMTALGLCLVLALGTLGCEPESPPVTGSDGASGSGNYGGFDFDVRGGDGGAEDASDAADTGDVAADGEDVSEDAPEDVADEPDPDCVETNDGVEACDGRDNDCNGVIDDGCDEDGDGYCAEDATVTAEAMCQPGDCNDDEAAVYPGAPAACDGLDNNCDGEVDNLVAEPSMRKTLGFDGAFSAGSSDPSPVLATFTGDGFCFAALDDAANQLELGHLATTGVASTHEESVASSRDVDLLDLAWDGTECAALYRESGTSLSIRRWRPGDSSAVTLEVTDKLSDNDDWESIRNAALWFGDVTRCEAGSCASQPRWVVVYNQAGLNVFEELVFKTVPKSFSSDVDLLPQVTLRDTVTANASVDVAGPGARNDDFLVVEHTAGDRVTLHGIVEEEPTELTALGTAGSAVTRGLLNTTGGETLLQNRVEQTVSRLDTRLNLIGTNSYRTEGSVPSDSDEAFIGRDFVSSAYDGGWVYLDAYSDSVFLAERTGTGLRFFDFTELSHPAFDRFTELLAPGFVGERVWVASMVDDSTYEFALDAFACQ